MQRGPAREWRALEAGPLQLRRALLRHAEPLRSTRLRRETWLSRALLRRLAWPCRLPQLLRAARLLLRALPIGHAGLRRRAGLSLRNLRAILLTILPTWPRGLSALTGSARLLRVARLRPRSLLRVLPVGRPRLLRA